MSAFDLMAYDGPSARWRFEFVKQNVIICGYVNGKNRLGAYSGWTPFTFDLEAGHFLVHQDDFRWLFDTACFDLPVPER